MNFELSEIHADGALVIRRVLGGASFVVDCYFDGNPRVTSGPRDPVELANYGQGITEHIDGDLKEHYPIRVATGPTISIALVERCVRLAVTRIFDARAQARAKSTRVSKMYPTGLAMVKHGVAVGTVVQNVLRALEGAKLGRFKDSIVP